jgi:hypothetical protein
MINAPPATAAIPATPIRNNKTIILTPDDLFALPGLEEWSTPSSGEFCEHLPQPQIVATPDSLYLLSGRFVLCIYERINTAVDLDTGSLVPTDHERGDLVLGSPGGGEKPTYGVFGWNNAYVKDAYILEAYANHPGVNNLSFEYCEDKLRDQSDQGAMYVAEQFVGDVGCVKTTESNLAMIRVEKIYPAVTLSVEFSFIVLKNE